MNARLPDFLIIGAQKAGTSWLHHQLRQHPDLYLPPDKDFEYFSYRTPPATATATWQARFAAAGANQRVGDACASYFWTGDFGADNPGINRDMPGTIARALGTRTRILVLLRNPVERTLSAYLHHIAFGSLDAATPVLDAPARLGLLALSRYGLHLENWLQALPPGQIRVLPAPGEADAAWLLEQACNHIGVEVLAAGDPEQPVFPGLVRRQRKDGIWVALDQPGVEHPIGPVREWEGRRWTRLVEPGEIEIITRWLAPDTARLRRCLARIGQHHCALEQWPTWPSEHE